MASHMTDNWYIRVAHRQYAEDGHVEIDDHALLSRNDELTSDHGAYVQAWVWVTDPEPHADANHSTLPAAVAARLDHDDDTAPLAFCLDLFTDRSIPLPQAYRARLRRILRRLGLYKTK